MMSISLEAMAKGALRSVLYLSGHCHMLHFYKAVSIGNEMRWDNKSAAQDVCLFLLAYLSSG